MISAKPSLPPSLEYRPEIDGLRALAVLSVVFFHAFPRWIPGGFVGVDVFFVISGYLITSLIFRAWESETWSFTQFYVRRINRIFPALILVLLSAYFFGFGGMNSLEFHQLAKHVASGAGFVANFVLWQESGYFDSAAVSKPLLHLWSLSIEEQFYLVWPLLMALLYRSHGRLPLALVLLGALSFAAGVFFSYHDTVHAFYSPLTRAWELIAGGVLACCVRAPAGAEGERGVLPAQQGPSCALAARLPVSPDVMAGVGLLLILAAVFGFDKTTVFPGAWALVPVLGTLLLIGAGKASRINTGFLALPAMVWVGRISYPLYLWHWLLLAALHLMTGGEATNLMRGGALLLSLGLAWLSYRLVEMPIRTTRYKRIVAVMLVLCMAALGLLGYSAYRDKTAISDQLGWVTPPARDEQVKWCNDMFPVRAKLSPKERDDNFCLLARNEKPNVVFIGDSMGYSVFPGLRDQSEFNAAVLAASQAAPFDDIRSTEFFDTIRLQNYQLTNQALDFVRHDPAVKLVVLMFQAGPYAAAPGTPFRMTNVRQPEVMDAHRVFVDAMRATLTSLRKAGKKIVFMLPNPDVGYMIQHCLRPVSPFAFAQQGECTKPLAEHLGPATQEYRKWVSEVLKDFPEVAVFDAAAPFCDAERCWGVRDGKILYRDSVHLSMEGSRVLAETLRPFIAARLQEAR